MDSLVSVIVPIYKVEAYLSRCLDSIVNQTYRNLEIILVDDGSPDNCGTICDDYAKRDNRIRVIHKENGGVSSARNAGLDIMQGNYLMFVDPDDWISPDAVQVLYDRMIQDVSDMAIAREQDVWAEEEMESDVATQGEHRVLSQEECLKLLGHTWVVPCCVWGKLYRKKIFANLRFHPLTRAEDVWILPHVIENCETISFVPDVLYYYYQRETSIVHSSGDMEHMDSMRASLHVARFLYDKGLVTGAGGYFYSARKEGRMVQERMRAKQLLEEVFTNHERRHIASRCYVHWRFFLPDGLHQWLRRLKRAAKRMLAEKM